MDFPNKLPEAQLPDGKTLSVSVSPFLKSVVDRLKDAYHPDAIYLFGSQARGTANPESDIDLLVIVDDAADRTRRGSQLAYRVLRPLGKAIDVLIWWHSKFFEETASNTSLPSTVIKEGILLYAT